MPNRYKTSYPLLAGCFLLSGAAGLIYEVVWSRQLTLFVGITTYAHTAVITAYMLGLAVGSLVIGRLSDRHPAPLRLYAWLEIGIGLYAAATPWLCPWLQRMYAEWAPVAGVTGLSSHLLRFLLVLLLLLPPTFGMGGTLPLMVRGLTARLPELAASTGRLYGLNTLGATLGTVVSGYLLLPAIGMRNTLLTGVALNITAAMIIFALVRNPGAGGRSSMAVHTKDRDRAVEPDADERRGFDGARLMLGLFALSGFAALAYEIAWIRALTLVLGSSVYSFSTTMAVFLAGLGLGSLAYGQWPRGSGRAGRLAQASVIEALAGFSAVVGLLVIGRLPEAFLWGYRQGWADHFFVFQLFIFGLCFLVMIVPTFLLGTLFPLMSALWTRQESSLGRDVGAVYAANTTGTIFGSLAAGLILLPVLGVHGTIILAAGLQVLAGAGFGWMRLATQGFAVRLTAAGGLAGCYGLVAAIMPPWDKAIMTSGVYNYAETMAGENLRRALQEHVQPYQMLYYRDGRDGTVSVLEDEHQRLLVINGKIDATTLHDLTTQVMVGQLPMLVHPNPRTVLMIGLGSGITAGSIATYPSVERLDIVELSPEVVAASTFFSQANRRVLADPRVHLVVADARNYLLATDRVYDVIVSEPSNPWLSGIANLFTYDFFRLLRAHLAPDGVAAQWFQTYNMSPADTRSVLHSFHQVFPRVSAWLSLSSDLIMLGTESPHALDARRLETALAQPELLATMRQVDMNGLGQIAKLFLFNGDSLDTYCAGAALNTDDRPHIEFHAPRNLYRRTTEETLQSILAHLAAHPARAPITGLARLEDRGIKAAPIGLSVSTGARLTDNQWTAEWKVWRQYYQTAKNSPDVVGVGSQARLEWREGSALNRLKAFHVDAAPSVEQLTSYLKVEQAGALRVGGEVELPGGSRGAWGLTQDSEDAPVRFLITWSAPSPLGGFFQYVAERDQPDPGRDNWGTALVQFAKCFTPLAN